MPGTKQYRGDGTIKYGPIVVDYGPKGMTTHFTAFCPNIQPLIAYYNYIVRFGASGTFKGLDVNQDGSLTAADKELEISLPGLINNYGLLINELFFDSWELLTNEATDSIFANPLIVGSSTGGGWMTANDKDVLSIFSRGNPTQLGALSSAISSADLLVPANAPHSTPTDGRSLQLILEIIKGQTEYQRPNYVLRHTSYCSPGILYNTSVAYTQCIYTPAQLLTEVGSGWTYSLPPRLYSKIASIPYQYAPGTEASYYQWGWLKTISRETQLSNFMIEVATEYALNLWSNIRYAPR